MSKKLGRNEKCYCGSGKKYKHCCLKNDNHQLEQKHTEYVFDEFEGFAMLEEKSKKLKQIFEKYELQGLIKAVFAINIYTRNRSSLESALAMNHCISGINSFGSEAIDTYSDFIHFYNKIEKILKPTRYDDHILEDFGEVKLRYNEKYYNVVIGNGFENVYGVLQFLEETVKQTGQDEECQSMLLYASEQIEFFRDVNKGQGTTYQTNFLVPDEELFDRSGEYIDLFLSDKKFNKLTEILDINEVGVKAAHFVTKENIVYPIYNSSLVLDFFNQLTKNMSKKQLTDTVEFSLYKTISKLITIDDPDAVKFLYPISIVDKVKFISKRYYSFLIVTDDGMILGVNSGLFDSEEELNTEIDKIIGLHLQDELMFAEVIKRKNQEGTVGISVPKECELKILVFDSVRNQEEHSVILKEADSKYSECTAADIIYFLHFMDDINELFRFLVYEESKKQGQLFSYGGLASNFLMWKESGEVVEKGAIEYSMMVLEHGSVDSYVYDFFVEKLAHFPFEHEDSFFDVFYRWRIRYQEEDGFYEFSDKISKSFGGYGKKYSNNVFLFFAMNTRLFDNLEYSVQFMTNIRLLDDLNMKNANAYSWFFGNNISMAGKLLHLVYIPFDKAQEEDNTGYTYDKSRQFVYSESMSCGDIITIRYAVNMNKLYAALNQSKNRSVESKYFLELMAPLERYCENEYKLLKSQISDEAGMPKRIGVFSVELEFDFSDKHIGFNISDISYHLARKEIAMICNNSFIEPGVYVGRDATAIVRKMQNELIHHFEKEIIKYNPEVLHIELTEIYAQLSFEIGIHKKRYSSFDDIEDNAKNQFRKKTISLREEAKHNIRTVQYMIETNVYLENDRGEFNIDRENIERLLAFSNWIVVLQDAADVCYRSELEKNIEVNHDFIVDIIESEDMLLYIKGLSERLYDDSGYTNKMDEEDKRFLNEFEQAFFEDTKVSFIKYMYVIDSLRLGYENSFAKECGCNVYSMDYEEFLNQVPDYMSDDISYEEAKCALDLLICHPSKLKYWHGKETDFLPINERVNRDNRFDVKPLVEYDGKLMFSPPVCHDLYNKWRYGLMEFYLPYEIGLKASKKAVLRWKKRYEDLIVKDTVEILKEKGIAKIWPEAKLHRLDKEGCHPEELGDYDVIAIDEKDNRLILIECKHLSLVGSYHEAYMQQYNFFLDKKYDEKFQRRIDYMEENYKNILFKLTKKEYDKLEIVPYMVTNKVFFSRYKKIDYKILSINELEESLCY